MRALLLFALLGAAGILAAARAALGDEITLNNGNVLEGEIIRETPEEVVIRTEFGEMKLRRAQIKSIRRVTVPGREIRPPETPKPEANADTLVVPGTGTRVPRLPDAWIRDAAEEQGKLVFRKPNGAVLVVEVAEGDGYAASLKDFVLEFGPKKLAGAAMLQQIPYKHSGFDAIRIRYQRVEEEEVLRELYAVDAGVVKAFVLFGCVAATFDDEAGAFWTTVEGLRLDVPAVPRGTTDRKEFVLGDLASPVLYAGPDGPWQCVLDETVGEVQRVGFGQDQARVLIVTRMPWHGSPEVLRDNADVLLAPPPAFSGKVELKNLKNYTAAGRLEIWGDVQLRHPKGVFVGRVRVLQKGCFLAIGLSLVRNDLQDRREAATGRFLDSIDIRWDEQKALDLSRWQTVRLQEQGCRIRVPGDWKAADSLSYYSLGGSSVTVLTGPKARYPANPTALNEFFKRMAFEDTRDITVVGEGTGSVGGRAARTLAMRVATVSRLGIRGAFDIVVYHGIQGDRFFMVAVRSPGGGFEKLGRVYEKILDSFEMD